MLLYFSPYKGAIKYSSYDSYFHLILSLVLILGIFISLRLLTLGLNNITVLNIVKSFLIIFINNILITLIYNALFKGKSC